MTDFNKVLGNLLTQWAIGCSYVSTQKLTLVNLIEHCGRCVLLTTHHRFSLPRLFSMICFQSKCTQMPNPVRKPDPNVAWETSDTINIHENLWSSPTIVNATRHYKNMRVGLLLVISNCMPATFACFSISPHLLIKVYRVVSPL